MRRINERPVVEAHIPAARVILSRVLVALVIAAFVALGSGVGTEASEALWSLLKGGGYVVLIRHAATDPGFGDPPGFRLEDCVTQRNLNDAGRAQAKRIGEAFRARGIPVTRVLSSPWCRCLETGQLAFGSVEAWTPLNSQFHDKSRADEAAREVRRRAGDRPEGGNLVMITHGTNIAAWTGVHPAQGEMVLLAPLGNATFRVAGRIPPPGRD